jgi:large subunit ribosomal protein L35
VAACHALQSLIGTNSGGRQTAPRPIWASAAPGLQEQGESEMPKLKTKSGAKKRFKMTGTGKVKAQAQGKRHGMIKRTAKFVRSARGTMVLNDSDAKVVKKYMPYAR